MGRDRAAEIRGCGLLAIAGFAGFVVLWAWWSLADSRCPGRGLTESTINVLQTALNSYKNTFGRNPPVHGGPGLPAGAPRSTVPVAGSEEDLATGRIERFETRDLSTGAAADRLARNRAVRLYLETAWPGVREAPFVLGSDRMLMGDGLDGIRVYADEWGRPLVFDRPGSDHTADVNEDGDRIEGRYDTSGRAGDEARWVFDIYSFGPDGIDGGGGHDHGDDIVSWGAQVRR